MALLVNVIPYAALRIFLAGLAIYFMIILMSYSTHHK